MSKWDQVLSVDDFEDGPKSGVVEFMGGIYVFEVLWDDDEDDYSYEWQGEERLDGCSLIPVSGDILPLRAEQLAITERWRQTLQGDLLEMPSHPALPAEVPRFRDLEKQIQKLKSENARQAIKVIYGRFRRESGDGPGIYAKWEVCWR